ncbi:MAG TPA: DedA family protein [Gammaproteobacteria bacterium]|nr:DedA family protein [Gammaproteobacteria bacterium]
MELITTFIDIVLHLDVHLAALLAQYGLWVYLILFAIIFCETGLVVTPFLPGDSLLFVVGTLAGTGGLEIEFVIPLLMAAALLGDNVNYCVGRIVGNKVFQWQQSRFFNRAAFDRTHAYYERHGGKTIIIARFLPLVRTFAPFVAGVAQMTYSRYLSFCVLGAALWVGLLCMAGYWFGNLPFIKDNLTLVILGIIFLSLLPLIIGYLRQRLAERRLPPAV